MRYWYRYTFKLKWNDKTLPNTWAEFYIVDTVIRNAINKFEPDCWRIHRRWNRDDAGHALMLHMFIDEEIGNTIHGFIEKDDCLTHLMNNDIIEEYFENDQKIKEFEGNGESSWPNSVQKSWPYFIQGVCHTLMEMISAYRNDTLDIDIDNLPKKLNEIENIYRKIELETSSIWQSMGSNIFLHHLNAIFGYTPVAVPMQNIGNVLIGF